MHENPRRRFRFGLISLFVLIAVVGVLACFWNPFYQPSRSRLSKIEIGMTEADVAELVGAPDAVEKHLGAIQTRYQLTAKDFWIVTFREGRVYATRPYRRIAPPPRLSSSQPTLLNPETTTYRPPDNARPAAKRNESLRGSITLEEARKLVGDQADSWSMLKAQREGKQPRPID